MLETHAAVVERAMMVERDINEYEKVRDDRKSVKVNYDSKGKGTTFNNKKRVATDLPKRFTPTTSQT